MITTRITIAAVATIGRTTSRTILSSCFSLLLFDGLLVGDGVGVVLAVMVIVGVLVGTGWTQKLE